MGRGFGVRAPGSRLRVAMGVLALLLLGIRGQSVRGAPAREGVEAEHSVSADGGMAGMSDADANRQVQSWFAAHPAHGERSTAAPADSFTVQNTNFDENHDLAATQVDTAKIFQGQTVLFKWVNGAHTITSGTGTGDPNAGALFDVPSDVSHPTFTFQFNSVGTTPFFCRPHVTFNMRGVVVVSPTVSVQPLTGDARRIGFTAPPWPNPTRSTTAFRFALRVGGHAHAAVYDAAGRLVAVPLEQDLAAGSYAAAWDARRRDGSPASPGAYLLSLEVPGAQETRRIVVER